MSKHFNEEYSLAFDYLEREAQKQINSINALYVTEKRAPTDESIRLLKEMEEEVKNNIIDSIRLTNNGFEGQVLVNQNYINGQLDILVVFKLNGKKIVTKFFINHFDVNHKDKWIPELIDAVAKDISIEILSNVFNKSIFQNIRI